MKTKKPILFLSTVILLTAFIIGCKKKKDETPEPQPAPAPVTPAHVNKFSAKVNGINWSMICNQGICGTIATKFGGTYSMGGQTNFSNPYTYISTNFTYTTGIVSLSKYGLFQGRYIDTANVTYRSVNGTLNITLLDTSSSPFKKFKATFSFNTDTVGGKSYQITEGNIDYESNL